MKITGLKTWLLTIIFFLLPWQTRYIFGQATVGDMATPFGVLSVHGVEILIILTAIVTLVRKQDRPTIELQYRLPLALAACIFVVSVLSLAWTSHLDVALNALLHVGTAMVLFALLLDKKVEVKPLLLGFVTGLLVPIGLGVWQVIFDSSPASTVLGLASRNAEALGDAVTVASDGARQLRAYGTFPHPNIFGGYLAVGVMALAGLLRPLEKYRNVIAISVFFFALMLALSASRAAMLGLVLGMFLAGLVVRMKNTVKARLAVIPIAVIVIATALFGTLFAPNIISAIRGGGATEERSLAERTELYEEYPAVVGSNWLLGKGLGTYAFAAYDAQTCSEWNCQPIHNVPLLIVGEIGLLGALIVIAWSSSIDRINFARFPNYDALVAFGMGNIVLVILFFDHYIWSQWSGLALIAFVMALTVRMGEEVK